MTTTAISTRGQVQLGGDTNDYRVVLNPITTATNFADASGLFIMGDFNPWVWADTKYEAIPWLFRPGVQVGPDQVGTRKLEFSVLAKAKSQGLGTGDARQTLRNLVAKVQRACHQRVDLSELGWIYADGMTAATENDNIPGQTINWMVGRYQSLSLTSPAQINLSHPWVKMRVAFEATDPFTYGGTAVTNTTAVVGYTTAIPRPLTYPQSTYYSGWYTGSSSTVITVAGEGEPRMRVTITGASMYNPILVAGYTSDQSVAMMGIGNNSADSTQMSATDVLVFDWATRTILLNGVDITTRMTLGSTWFTWNSSKGTPKVTLSLQGTVGGVGGTASTSGLSTTISYYPAYYLMG